MLDADKHALPTQMRTEHGMIHVKALGFSNHFAPRDRAALRSGSLPRCVIVRADLNAEDAEFFAKERRERLSFAYLCECLSVLCV